MLHAQWGTMAKTLSDLLKDDERSPLTDEDLDTAIWLCLIQAICEPADLDRFEPAVSHYFASRLLQWDVANGGFAQAAVNIAPWFERAAAGYQAIGAPRLTSWHLWCSSSMR